MKSNASDALFAVYLFGLIVSLNSLPMVPGGGETSWASETSNTLHKSIRNYIINILTYKNPEQLTQAVMDTITATDFLKKIDDLKYDNFVLDYSKFQLDPEFIAWVTEAKDQILLGVREKNQLTQEKKTREALLDITKKKINEKKGKNELRTLEFYAHTDEEFNEVITDFIGDVKFYV